MSSPAEVTSSEEEDGDVSGFPQWEQKGVDGETCEPHEGQVCGKGPPRSEKNSTGGEKEQKVEEQVVPKRPECDFPPFLAATT